MGLKSPTHLEVKAKVDPRKSKEQLNDDLIRKFLKKCSKENLLKFLFEKSADTRRFTDSSEIERMRRRRNKYRAQRDNLPPDPKTDNDK